LCTTICLYEKSFSPFILNNAEERRGKKINIRTALCRSPLRIRRRNLNRSWSSSDFSADVPDFAATAVAAVAAAAAAAVVVAVADCYLDFSIPYQSSVLRTHD